VLGSSSFIVSAYIVHAAAAGPAVQFKPAAVAAHHVYALSAMVRTLSPRAARFYQGVRSTSYQLDDCPTLRILFAGPPDIRETVRRSGADDELFSKLRLSK